jgi:putative holliday junction resolvase
MKVDLDIPEPNSGRIIAFDYGTRRIGVALSDPNRIIAQPHTIIEYNTPDDALMKCLQLIGEFHPLRIIIGIPKRTDGKTGTMETLAREFIALLKTKTQCEIIGYPEWFSSKEASLALSSIGISAKQQQRRIDANAASLILQAYLDSIKYETKT